MRGGWGQRRGVPPQPARWSLPAQCAQPLRHCRSCSPLGAPGARIHYRCHLGVSYRHASTSREPSLNVWPIPDVGRSAGAGAEHGHGLRKVAIRLPPPVDGLDPPQPEPVGDLPRAHKLLGVEPPPSRACHDDQAPARKEHGARSRPPSLFGGDRAERPAPGAALLGDLASLAGPALDVGPIPDVGLAARAATQHGDGLREALVVLPPPVDVARPSGAEPFRDLTRADQVLGVQLSSHRVRTVVAASLSTPELELRLSSL